jgi:hypothetical protein
LVAALAGRGASVAFHVPLPGTLSITTGLLGAEGMLVPPSVVAVMVKV